MFKTHSFFQILCGSKKIVYMHTHTHTQIISSQNNIPGAREEDVTQPHLHSHPRATGRLFQPLVYT